MDERQSVVVCDGLDETLRDIVPLGDTDKLALWVAERLCVPVDLGDADTLPEGDKVLLLEVEYVADEDRDPEPLSELLTEYLRDAEKLRVKACVVPMAVTDEVTLTEGEATRDLLAMPETLGEGEKVSDTLGERDMLGHGDVVEERHKVGDTETEGVEVEDTLPQHAPENRQTRLVVVEEVAALAVLVVAPDHVMTQVASRPLKHA